MSTLQGTKAPSETLLASVNGTRANKNEGDTKAAQDRFMTLLVTQMKNQDPLNPMDNSQMTSQLAQLSTVSGIEKLNSTLETLMGSYKSSQSLQAANMIGHGVLVPGSHMNLVDGQAIFGIDMATPADNLKVTIRDATGKAVQTMNLGSKETGVLPLTWDGKTDTGATAPNGKYTFEVEGTVAGEKIKSTYLSFGQVVSVATGTQGVKINVPTLGEINFSEVRQIL